MRQVNVYTNTVVEILKKLIDRAVKTALVFDANWRSSPAGGTGCLENVSKPKVGDADRM
jgi:hypothetical protein